MSHRVPPKQCLHVVNEFTLYRELHRLPEDTHWFCPKTSPDDGTSFSDNEDDDDFDDETEEERKRRKHLLDNARSEGRKRLALAMDGLSILAFDGSDAQEFQNRYSKGLTLQLTRCDACIRSYYRSLPGFLQGLHENYEPEHVQQFSQVIDNMNFERIKGGLERAKKDLLRLPENERSVKKMGAIGLYGLFEALSCSAFFRDEDLMSMHFDRPFKLVQPNKKRLKMTAYVPAMTAFLFSDNQDRYDWAYTTWIKFNKPMIKADFEWAVQDFLLEAMERVQIHNLDVSFLPAFWSGARVIVKQLDKDLITHSLRALDVDICKLALEHLQIDSEGFPDLLGTLHMLLSKSPNDFWDAMGTISPVTVVEQIFNAPSLERLLRAAGQNGPHDLDVDALSWVEPLLQSLKPINQSPACRALLHQLFGRLQGDKYTTYAKDHFRQMGLRVLDITLRSLLNTQASNSPISEATVSEVLEMVEQQIPKIAAGVRSLKTSLKHEKEARLGLQIVQHAVSLDCKVLVVDFERLTSNSSQQQQKARLNATQSDALWRTLTKSITKDDVNLAARALLGCRELTGLEPFVVKPSSALQPDQKQFNETFKKTSDHVRDLLQKLSDFSEVHLQDLFNIPTNASAIFATLFSSNQEIHDASLEVLKAAASATGRREALEFALKRYFSNTLSMSSNYLLRIAQFKVFAPMSRGLKLCGDMVDVLCNPQDGILRTRTLSLEESRAVEGFWTSMWQVLTVIFNHTEAWSRAGHSKDLLKDFCQETMQFADGLFQNYAIFRTALRQADVAEKQSTAKIGLRLLDHPKNASKGIIIWLRLRDEYLINKSVSLVCMLLTRLKEEAIELASQTLFSIENIIRGETKSNLSRQQVAELTQALEIHTGRELDDDDEDDRVVEIAAPRGSSKLLPKNRQGQLDIGLWRATAESRKTESGASSGTESPDDALARARGKVSLLDARKPQAIAQKQTHQRDQSGRVIPSRNTPTVPPPKAAVDVNEIRKIRQREKEAKEKRDAAARAQAQKIRAGTGAGSGVKGIGVHGKDHAPKGEGIYVDSDESSDDGELDRELFGISAVKPRKPAALTAEQLALKQVPQLPVKKKKVVRTQSEMRARLAPDLSKLHSTILGWEYFHDGDYPPGSRTDIFSAVPNRFTSPVHYKQVFQPLLELEAWQGFVKSREENTFKPYEIKVSNRATVDSFVEVSTTMTHADNKDIQIGEGDVVLISKEKSPATAHDAPHCLARVFRITRRKDHLEILYRVVPGNPLLGSLVPNSSVYGVKIQSMTPLEREYGALCSLEYYDLCDEIVNAKPSPLLNYTDKQLDEFISTYNVNKAQAKAIRSAIDNDAFTLIQG